MKRYWVFAGDKYYPIGGMKGFVDSFDDIEDAIDKGREEKPISPGFWIRGTFDWCQVVDITTGQIVFQEDDLEEDRRKRGCEARDLAFDAWEKECEGK